MIGDLTEEKMHTRNKKRHNLILDFSSYMAWRCSSGKSCNPTSEFTQYINQLTKYVCQDPNSHSQVLCSWELIQFLLLRSAQKCFLPVNSLFHLGSNTKKNTKLTDFRSKSIGKSVYYIWPHHRQVSILLIYILQQFTCIKIPVFSDDFEQFAKRYGRLDELASKNRS